MVRLTRWVAIVAFIALLGMMGVTLADIVLRVISRLPGDPFAGIIPAAVPGVVDLVELTLVAVAHLSIAVTFLLGTHVSIDIVAALLPPRLRNVTRRIGWAVSLAFMLGCLYQAYLQGQMQFGSGLVSATISLPMWWFWIPVVAGTGLAALACLWHLVRRAPAPGRSA